MEEDGKDRILGLQAVLEVESDEKHFQLSNLEATRMFNPLKTRNLGKYAFVTMLVGGLTSLWIYSRLPESLNLQTLATLQQTISRVGFTVWQKNHTHRVSCTHHCSSCPSLRTRGTLTFILRCLFACRFHRATKVSPPLHSR